VAGGRGRGDPESEREQPSLVEALDDLGPDERYSVEGYRRLSALSTELRRLRRRVAGPLGELVAEVERVIGIDIEVAARADRAGIGRVHLDRFLDEAARFSSESDESTLRAFLAYLDAAEAEENGLAAGDVVVEAERVQILTVHGAKGLEWDVVAVPGLVDKIFPAEPRGVNWARARHELPGPLRGDASGIPVVDIGGAADLDDVRDRLKAHHDALVERHAQEERRLAYVALTRARSVLIASAYAWDSTKTARTPSPYLETMRESVDPDSWFVPTTDVNPLTARARSETWPADPLGPGRRAAVEAGAALVRAGAVASAEAPTTGLAAQWRHDVDVLLAERAPRSPVR
jgi:DNA helicase-2/ATP-dependent DNA helicase PcrA